LSILHFKLNYDFKVRGVIWIRAVKGALMMTIRVGNE